MKVDKNCVCCGQSYGSYTIGKDSEVFHDQCVIPLGGVEPKGLCGFCNPKSTVWYTPKMKCHFLT